MENVLICTVRSTWATASHSHWSTQSQTQTASCRLNTWTYWQKWNLTLSSHWWLMKCIDEQILSSVPEEVLYVTNQVVGRDFSQMFPPPSWSESDQSHKTSVRNIQSHRHRWCFIPFYEPSGSSGRALCASAILSAICQLSLYDTHPIWEKCH